MDSFRWPSSGAVSSPVSAPLVVVPALALVDTPRTFAGRANRRFQIMFRKFCFRKQAAGGFRRRGPTRRAFARCVRCRCTGFFSAVGRACLARHGAALIVGLAAPRRPRRQPRRLQLLVLGLRLPAASCLVGVALQPHIVAAWRRPPRGAPAGPRCPGRMRSGRPFKVADACCGLVHAQRPSGEYGLRSVARAFLCAEGNCGSLHASRKWGRTSRIPGRPSPFPTGSEL